MIDRLCGCLDVARGAWWALRAVYEARKRLKSGGLAGFSLTPPPTLPAGADRGVRLILGCLRPSCLERALVLQRWLMARGRAHEVVVGVRKAGADFRAHAWIDTEESWQRQDFQEIARFGP